MRPNFNSLCNNNSKILYLVDYKLFSAVLLYYDYIYYVTQ